MEQLPSGSFRVFVYAGTDALTRRAIRLKSTVKSDQQAHIELGRRPQRHRALVTRIWRQPSTSGRTG